MTLKEKYQSRGKISCYVGLFSVFLFSLLNIPFYALVLALIFPIFSGLYYFYQYEKEKRKSRYENGQNLKIIDPDSLYSKRIGTFVTSTKEDKVLVKFDDISDKNVIYQFKPWQVSQLIN